MHRRLDTEIDRSMVIAYIQRLDLKKRYTVDVVEKRVKRTISQNALYWLWLTCIMHETGNDKNDLHDHFMKLYLQPEKIRIFGVESEKYTTTGLNTAQFTTYLNSIQSFAAADLGIIWPDPNDKQWEEFFKYYQDK